jgi:hypothetical protein
MTIDEVVAVGDGVAMVAGEVDYLEVDPTSCRWRGSRSRLVY